MKVKRKSNPIVLAFAVVGFCAILYGLYAFYWRQQMQQNHQNAFSEPLPSGLPNFLGATPGQSPPQP